MNGSAPGNNRDPHEAPFFHRVYDVLVEICHATDDESNRIQWESFWMRDGGEYRFIGSLGFGGKFYRTRGDWHVSCYPEDLTPERAERIAQANTKLGALRRTWLDDATGLLEDWNS